jgi:hypothetical protein
MPLPETVRAVRDVPYAERLVRLGRALVALSHDLADSRREIIVLERENAALRDQIRQLERR